MIAGAWHLEISAWQKYRPASISVRCSQGEMVAQLMIQDSIIHLHLRKFRKVHAVPQEQRGWTTMGVDNPESRI